MNAPAGAVGRAAAAAWHALRAPVIATAIALVVVTGLRIAITGLDYALAAPEPRAAVVTYPAPDANAAARTCASRERLDEDERSQRRLLHKFASLMRSASID